LYFSGYLHNHARLWLSSYLVHIRKVHWRAAAEWMYSHLIDGDIASNHLSWQWVAGTGSHKPYLFNAENVALACPRVVAQPQTVIDKEMDIIDMIATVAPHLPSRNPGIHLWKSPHFTCKPPAVADLVASGMAADKLVERDVWWIHPWAIQQPFPSGPTHRCDPHCCMLAKLDRATPLERGAMAVCR
jgi:deoxyribodipyrimidine photo-lyase